MSNIKSEFQRLAVAAAQKNGVGNFDEETVPNLNSTLYGIPMGRDRRTSNRGMSKKVSFKLSSEQRIAIYQDVMGRLQAKQDIREIARDVVAAFEEHLQEKEDESTNKIGPKGPIFRRTEQ